MNARKRPAASSIRPICAYGQPTRSLDPSPGHSIQPLKMMESTCSPGSEQCPSAHPSPSPWLDHSAPPTQQPLLVRRSIGLGISHRLSCPFPSSFASFLLFLIHALSLSHTLSPLLTLFSFLPSLTHPPFLQSLDLLLFSSVFILESSSLCCATRSRIQPPPKLSSPYNPSTRKPLPRYEKEEAPRQVKPAQFELKRSTKPLKGACSTSRNKSIHSFRVELCSVAHHEC